MQFVAPQFPSTIADLQSGRKQTRTGVLVSTSKKFGLRLGPHTLAGLQSPTHRLN